MPNDQPDITYEDVDTSLVPPRPRLYGLVGAAMHVIVGVLIVASASVISSGGSLR